VSLAGADAGNYTVGSAADTTADITPFVLTATATAADKVYDATTTADVTISLATVFAGDAVSGSASGSFSDKNVGTDKTVTVGAVTLAGADVGNYSVGSAADTTAGITPGALTVTANASSKIVGSADPVLTFSTSGLVGGDTETIALTGALSRQSGEAVGNYGILQGTLLAVNGNYEITFVSANFVILNSSNQNVAPVITSLTDTTWSVPDEIVQVMVEFTDDNLTDVHTVMINWGDGTATAGVVTEAGGVGEAVGSHQYADAGVYNITVTVDDGQGGSDVETTSSMIAGVRLLNGVLFVIGTDGRDHVNITENGDCSRGSSDRGDGRGRGRGSNGRTGSSIRVNAKLNQGRDQVRINESWHLHDVDSIVMHLGDGDDFANLAGGSDACSHGCGNGGVNIPATAFAGDGDDKVFGGDAADILIGGSGNDKLYGRDGNDLLAGGTGNDNLDGGRGHDVLIGGKGRDDLHGGSGDDLLIGGFTAFEEELSELDEFLSRWAVGDSVDDFTSQISDDYEKDKLNGGHGSNVGFGGYRDKLKL